MCWGAVENKLNTKAGDMPMGLSSHSGIRLKMSQRVDLACFDEKNARRGMSSCHITDISLSGTA